MNVESRALALLVVFVLGLGPLAPAVIAQEKASELENLKKQMLQMEEQFRQLQGQIEKLEKQAVPPGATGQPQAADRSEEHTSELQSRLHLVCRLLLEKKNFTPDCSH